MKKTIIKINRLLSLVLCIVLIAAMTLFTTACSDNEKQKETTPDETVTVASNVSESENGHEDNIIGQGNTKFYFTVTDKDGVEEEFEINTDKKTVGEALMEYDLIDGEDGDYGLYVKTVNGITVDYDTDGKYWAFYVNGEYGMNGVDTTEITDGATYSFKVE